MVIFFDVDDTLVDSKSAHLFAIRQLCKEKLDLNDHPDISAQWIKITDKYLSLYFQNRLTLRQQRIMRITEFFSMYGKKISGKEADEFYRLYHYYFLDNCSAFPDTIPALDSLKVFRLGIITNGTSSDQMYKLEHNNISGFFEEIIVSDEAGFSKPEKEIFMMASERMRIRPADCIYVGNSYNIDYQGSVNAGMKGILLDRDTQGKETDCQTISQLNELTTHPFII